MQKVGRILRTAAVCLASGGLVVGLSTAVTPASAEPGGDPTLDETSAARAARPVDAPFRPRLGRVTAPNQKLRKGCHSYVLRYRLNLPEEGRDDWAAEFFITNSRGKGVASPVAIVGADPLRGRKRYRFCRPSVGFGRHKIDTKVTYVDDGDTLHEGRLRLAYFRFTKPRRSGPPN